MKKNCKKIVSAALILSLSLGMFLYSSPHNSVLAYSADNSAQQKAQDLANSLVNSGAISVQYAVCDNGETTVSGTTGVSDKSTGKAPTMDTIYGMGSVSKTYVTTCAMQLVEEGKLDLDTPVVNYVPEFTMADERYKEITPRMLMNHSSGLYGSCYHDTMNLGDNIEIRDEFLNYISTQTLKADPGEFSVYCNDGFELLEILVEDVSKETYKDYLCNHVSVPLGLSKTKTPFNDFNRDMLAKCYLPCFQEALPFESVSLSGSGGLYSTAEEISKFGMTFTNMGTSILSSSSVEKMSNAECYNGAWPKDGTYIMDYGLGLDCVNLYPFSEYNISALVKGGDTSYYHAAMVVLPQYNICAAFMTSDSSSTSCEMAASSLLEQILIDKGIISQLAPDPTVSSETTETDVPSDIVNKCAGTYIDENYVYDVSFINNQCILKNNVTNKETTMTFNSDKNKFYCQEKNMQCWFEQASNGETYLTQYSAFIKPNLGRIKLDSFIMQKVEPTSLPADIKNAWIEHVSKLNNYLLNNDNYASSSYLGQIFPFGDNLSNLNTGSNQSQNDILMSAASSPNSFINENTGAYLMGMQIIDANNAKSVLKLPCAGGRDRYDFIFSQADGKNYLFRKGIGCNYINTDSIGYISSEGTVRIENDGYVQWMKVPENLYGAKISVTSPEKSSVIVYDNTNTPVYYSGISSGDITLPESGKVAFVASAGSEFTYKDAAFNMKNAQISSIADIKFTSQALEPDFTVTLNETTLTKNTDYTVSYSNNTSVGKATATITGIGKYYNSANTTFNIIYNDNQQAAYNDINAINDDTGMADVYKSYIEYQNLTDIEKAQLSEDVVSKLAKAEERFSKLNHSSGNVTVDEIPWFIKVTAAEVPYNWVGDGELITAYDISLSNAITGQEYKIQSDQSAAVKVSNVDKLSNYEDAKVFHEGEEVSCIVSGTDVSFTAKSFSIYGIFGLNNSSGISSKTGDNSAMILSIAFASLLFSGFAIIISKKRIKTK